MTKEQLQSKLEELQSLKSENEIVEFKEANNSYDFNKLGKYFSALSNEANLQRKKCGWLVFGIENKKHKIVGTKFRENRIDLDNLKREIADKTSNRITFIEIHEVFLPEGRVILFQIPPSPSGLPVAFEGHFYGRDGESLVPLNLEELERIRFQQNSFDWTSQIVPLANINDLDEQAIAKARIEFKKRNPKYDNEIADWNDAKFLDKAKITIKGKITRTALILLGKDEAEHFLGSFVKIRWNLKSLNNQDKDFEIFSIPLLLAVDAIYAKIRNLKYRYLRDGTLFPDEVLRYAPFNIREPLNNAIAHQDYTKSARINVVEFEDDHLVFSNYGTFLPKSIEDVVLNDAPEEIYRNPYLVEAMKNLDMIETQGGGIRKIFNFQRERFFPMPDYDLENDKFKVTITGKIINEDFARILIRNPKLELEDVFVLDKVQKQKLLTEQEFKHIKKFNFIEGRKPNVFLSSKVIQPTSDEGLMIEYIANRSFDDAHFKEMIIEYLKKFGKAKRSTIDNLIIPKLSAILSNEQKKAKVRNMLTALRKERKIQTVTYGTWQLF